MKKYNRTLKEWIEGILNDDELHTQEETIEEIYNLCIDFQTIGINGINQKYSELIAKNLGEL